jgi:hypothetical protein
MKKAKIINTGNHLKDASRIERLGFIANQKKIVTPKIHQQSKRDKAIIYGGEALNALLPRGMHRPSSDFDIMSKKQLKHAVELEKHIDTRMNRDTVHVKQLPHPTGRGRLYRVGVTNEDFTVADYSPMRKTKIVIKKGVRYESLGEAERKYNRMIETGDRFVKPSTDLGRIKENKLINKMKRRRIF